MFCCYLFSCSFPTLLSIPSMVCFSIISFGSQSNIFDNLQFLQNKFFASNFLFDCEDVIPVHLDRLTILNSVIPMQLLNIQLSLFYGSELLCRSSSRSLLLNAMLNIFVRVLLPASPRSRRISGSNLQCPPISLSVTAWWLLFWYLFFFK